MNPKNFGHIGGKIIIGNNVWIGANTVILKDVIINDNSVIGAFGKWLQKKYLKMKS